MKRRYSATAVVVVFLFACLVCTLFDKTLRDYHLTELQQPLRRLQSRSIETAIRPTNGLPASTISMPLQDPALSRILSPIAFTQQRKQQQQESFNDENDLLSSSPEASASEYNTGSDTETTSEVILLATGSNTGSSTKPVFYLIVGPHKTGLTFVQNTLCHKFNETDYVIFLGTCAGIPDPDHPTRFVTHSPLSVFQDPVPHHQPYVILAQKGRYAETKRQYPINDDHNFLTRLDELKNASTVSNVMMIYEHASYFSDTMIEDLKQLLIPTWTVQVLVLHRYFHDWLLTIHNTIHRLHDPQDYQDWTRSVVPFDLSNDSIDTTKMFLGMETQRTHIAQFIQQLYQRHFGNVVKIVSADTLERQSNNDQGDSFEENMPVVGDPLLQYILCDFINSPANCAQERQGFLSAGDTTSSFMARAAAAARLDMTVDLIAQEAHQRQVVPTTANRKQVFRLIHDQLKFGFQNMTEASLPMTCPMDTEMGNRFLRVSEIADSKILKWSDHNVVGAQHASFRTMFNDKRFCHVNAVAVLDMPLWTDFFRQIKWDNE